MKDVMRYLLIFKKKIMKIFLLILIFFLIPSLGFAGDEKKGRFFEDQPDVSDDYQIHFIYMLDKDGKDNEWDINGEMEKELLELNEKCSN